MGIRTPIRSTVSDLFPVNEKKIISIIILPSKEQLGEFSVTRKGFSGILAGSATTSSKSFCKGSAFLVSGNGQKVSKPRTMKSLFAYSIWLAKSRPHKKDSVLMCLNFPFQRIQAGLVIEDSGFHRDICRIEEENVLKILRIN